MHPIPNTLYTKRKKKRQKKRLEILKEGRDKNGGSIAPDYSIKVIAILFGTGCHTDVITTDVAQGTQSRE